MTIPPQERDVELVDKLKAEWPGIVAWMIQGCLDWQAQGLKPPRAVLEATEAYLSAEDAIAEWTDEKCERDPKAWASSSELTDRGQAMPHKRERLQDRKSPSPSRSKAEAFKDTG